MIDQHLFDNWQKALNHKQGIINNRGAYYYSRQVATKHKTKIFGINAEPYYTYHQERIFKDQQYNQDLAVAEQNINNCSRAVDNKIWEYRRELESANRTKSNIEGLRESIATLRSQTESYGESTSQLQVKVSQATQEISSLGTRMIDVTNSIQVARQEHNQIQDGVTRTNEAISNFEQQINSIDQQIHNSLSSTSDKQRADMLAAIIDYPEAEQAVNIIVSLGYDVNYLAYLAIEKNHAILLDLCIRGNAQWTKYAVDGQTLLQRAISSDKNLLVSKILEMGQELDTTLLNAINGSDLKTIRSIANHDESYLHKLIHGYSLLHIAISAGKHEVVEEILNLDIDHSCVSDLTSSGESAFKIALKCSSEQIINILIPLVNVEHELSSLISSHARTLFERAMLYCKTNAETNQLLLVKALESNELEIAAFLDHQGADFSKIFERANINHDEHILQNIIEIKPEFIDLLGTSMTAEVIQRADLDILGNGLTNLSFYEE